MTLKEMQESGSFIKLPSPIKGNGFNIEGIFAYNTAAVRGNYLPRQLSTEVFKYLPVKHQNNRIVIICTAGKAGFAVEILNHTCVYGAWSDITLL